MKDERSNLAIESGLDPAAIGSDTTTNGNWIDRQEYEALTFAVTGTITDGTFTPLVEESDQAGHGDAAPAADADLIGTEAGAAVDSAGPASSIGYVGSKRWVRCSLVSTGVTSGGTLAVTAILSHARHQPATS